MENQRNVHQLFRLDSWVRQSYHSFLAPAPNSRQMRALRDVTATVIGCFCDSWVFAKDPGIWAISIFSFNKTGTRQCTRAVWSTFADNHSTHPGALMHYSACRSFEAKDSWTTSHCFHRISFCSRVTHVRSRNALLNITKYMSSTGLIMNFGRLRLTCRDQACKQIIRRIEMADNAYLAVFAVVACCFSYFACSNGRMREENLSWLCIWKVCNGIEPLYFCGCSKQD